MRTPAAPPAAVLVALLAWRVTAAADLPEIQARGALRVLVSAHEEPEAFSFLPDGPPGFDRELLEGFARLQHLRLEVVQVERFADTIPALKAGGGDLITGIIATEARRQEIEFSAEVLPARFVTVSRAPRAAPASLEQLKGETVGVVPGNAWARVVEGLRMPRSKTVTFSDVTAMLDGLKQGRITATVMSAVDFTLSKRRDPALRAGVAVGPAASGAWGVRKADSRLREALDAHLSAVRRSGSWSQLVVKYYGQDALDVLGRRRE